MTSCGCCSALKPRYKRLVDNIFPIIPEEGLVRSEMEKLTYYAVSAPEKLDRIGVYLARRLERDIVRGRNNCVFIAMEALNQLLLACHAQQINLFVESFLKMVATLLESDSQELQSLGTHSFEKFSKIEEDTASYHRRYDFFVSKFSSMCHSNCQNANAKLKTQLNGILGLRGVIRKTVTDELQVNIWEKQHMDKIISSLLYSMQNDLNEKQDVNCSPLPGDAEHPAVLAEESIRELLSRAAFSNVPAAILPALSHMDNHKLWVPDNSFAIKCFKIIMYSVQGHYSHVVVKMLLDHLDTNASQEQLIKASILEILCAVVPIPSSTAIGPSVIDVFNRLSHHLKLSAKGNQQEFANALIETTGVLAGVVPDYQKLEIVSFYVNKAHEIIGGISNDDLEIMVDVNKQFPMFLLQCLQRISKTYRGNSFSSLTSSLLDPLLKVATLSDPSERILAQEVLVSLLDKNQNKDKLILASSHSDVEDMGLISSTAGKYDADFLDKRLPSIYNWLFENFAQEDNTVGNYISLYKCALVLCLSIVSPDIIVEMCRLTLAVQNNAVDLLNSSSRSESVTKHVSQVLASTGNIMLVLAHLSAVPEFQHYVNQLMITRNSIKPQLMPQQALNQQPPKLKSFKLESENLAKVIFTNTAIYNTLSGRSGYNAEKLNQPFLANLTLDTLSAEGPRFTIDVESINVDFSVDTKVSTVVTDGTMPAHAITYNYLKTVCTKPPLTRAEQMAKNRRVAEHIRSAPFEQLMAEMDPDPTVQCQQWVKQVLENEVENVEEDGLQFPSICLL